MLYVTAAGAFGLLPAVVIREAVGALLPRPLQGSLRFVLYTSLCSRRVTS